MLQLSTAGNDEAPAPSATATAAAAEDGGNAAPLPPVRSDLSGIAEMQWMLAAATVLFLCILYAASRGTSDAPLHMTAMLLSRRSPLPQLLPATLPLASPPPTLESRIACWTDARNISSTAWFNLSNYSSGEWYEAEPLYDTSEHYYGEVAFRNKPAPKRTWHWRPASWCPDEPANLSLTPTREEACKLLGSREVLVVGDSLNEEIFGSLCNFLAQTAADFTTNYLRREPNAAAMCHGAVRLFFVRNDRISLVEQVQVIDGFYEYPWTHIVRRNGNCNGGATLLVLFNRGAHYENDTIVLGAIAAAFGFLEAVAPKAVAIWRSTQHGHPYNKGDFHAAPLAPGSDMSPETLSKLPYDWGLLPAQSALAVELIRQSFPRAVVLDTGPALGLRQDGHLDGLHYGIPGPLDFVLETLLHFLPEIVAQQDSISGSMTGNYTASNGTTNCLLEQP